VRRGAEQRTAVIGIMARLLLIGACCATASCYTPATPIAAGRAASRARSAASAMVLNMPLPPSPLSFAPWMKQQPERLREGGTEVDFMMEAVHLTKRRVSGGVLVNTPAAPLWRCLTSYEQLPDFIPSIISNAVDRRADGTVSIEQESLLSRRLNLRTHMTLDAIEVPSERKLILRRTAGHGFLEFEGTYSLMPRPGGQTYLSYSVDLVPCPIFPLPLVEQKIRKEVPRMLVAIRSAAQRGAFAS